MLQVLEIILIGYLCILESITTYHVVYKPKRKYQRKVKSNLKVLRGYND